MVASQLERFQGELQVLAKGKGTDVLNRFKLDMLNILLRRANVLLGTKYAAIVGFTEFDPDQLPSTSDTVLVVSQYLGALEKLRTDNIYNEYATWYWMIGGQKSASRTAAPAKLGKK